MQTNTGLRSFSKGIPCRKETTPARDALPPLRPLQLRHHIIHHLWDLALILREARAQALVHLSLDCLQCSHRSAELRPACGRRPYRPFSATINVGQRSGCSGLRLAPAGHATLDEFTLNGLHVSEICYLHIPHSLPLRRLTKHEVSIRFSIAGEVTVLASDGFGDVGSGSATPCMVAVMGVAAAVQRPKKGNTPGEGRRKCS